MKYASEFRDPTLARGLLSAIADSADGSIPEGILRASGRGAAPMEVRITDWPSARGGTRVRGVLTRSAVGPVTVLKSPPKSPQVLGLAALVAGAWDARQEDAHGRLALALAMEGMLAWYREAHRMTPPRQAVEAARMPLMADWNDIIFSPNKWECVVRMRRA